MRRIKIIVNGQTVSVEEDMAVDEFIVYLEKTSFNTILMGQPYMLLLNGKLVHEEEYPIRIITHEDQVSIIPLVAGG